MKKRFKFHGCSLLSNWFILSDPGLRVLRLRMSSTNNFPDCKDTNSRSLLPGAFIPIPRWHVLSCFVPRAASMKMCLLKTPKQ